MFLVDVLQFAICAFPIICDLKDQPTHVYFFLPFYFDTKGGNALVGTEGIG
jgi:hypothetical protein